MKQLTNLQKLEVEEQVRKNERENVIDMDELKKSLLDKRIEEILLKSEEDYENGRVRDAEEVFKEWKIKYGIWNQIFGDLLRRNGRNTWVYTI